MVTDGWDYISDKPPSGYERLEKCKTPEKTNKQTSNSIPSHVTAVYNFSNSVLK